VTKINDDDDVERHEDDDANNDDDKESRLGHYKYLRIGICRHTASNELNWLN
jgi:hypothetical protein